MEKYKVRNLSFYYPNSTLPALYNINFSIYPGDFICLTGASGSGKTTLLKLLKPALSPYGEKDGDIFFEGEAIENISFRSQTEKIGFVMQNPDNQLVTDKVWHELAFLLESLGLKNFDMRLKVKETADFFNLNEYMNKNTSTLSGGEKQLLNLASVMAANPDVIILDEPLAQLDPKASSMFLSALEKLNKSGKTIIFSGHRLKEALPLCNRAIVLKNGRLIIDCPVNELRFKPVPLTGNFSLSKNILNENLIPALDIEYLSFEYEVNKLIFNNLSLKIYTSEIFALMGENGAGKTTLISLLSRFTPFEKGNLKLFGKNLKEIPANDLYNGKIGVMPQNPDFMFLYDTVESELYNTPTLLNFPSEERTAKILEISKLCDIDHIISSHPYDLSGGEKQRLGLAKLVLLNPKILFLDEPTKGLDAELKISFSKLLKDISSKGIAILLVTHDYELAALCANRFGMLNDGKVDEIADIHAFIAENNVKSEVLELPEESEMAFSPLLRHVNVNCGNKDKLGFKIQPLSLLFLLMIPFTVFIGARFPLERRFLLTGMLIILETFAAFAAGFEARKPPAKEILILSVLSAIAVAGRIAFLPLPQFKPVIAIIILTGACFGAEAGFLTGSAVAFISNFFTGQGPWTPWQMFAMGLIGFLAGVIFTRAQKKRLYLCIFGGLSTVLIYGGIMNAASVIMFQGYFTKEMLYFSYAAGLPFDLIHAASTVFFLWIISMPIIKKLERIKLKFGIDRLKINK